MKKYDGGKHGDPMIYGVRLTQWRAKLVRFTGDGWKHVVDHELQYVGEEEGGPPTMGDAAEALWLEGAHPESQLLVWEGTEPTRGRMMMLGTAVLSVAVGIVRAEDLDDDEEPEPVLAVAA